MTGQSWHIYSIYVHGIMTQIPSGHAFRQIVFIIPHKVHPSIMIFCPSTLIVHPEQYLSTYLSDLMQSW